MSIKFDLAACILPAGLFGSQDTPVIKLLAATIEEEADIDVSYNGCSCACGIVPEASQLTLQFVLRHNRN